MSTPSWFSDGWPHVWLPYTQMQTAAPPVPVSHAEGCYIYGEDGSRLIDGISSWWSVSHGHQHPHMVQAMKAQLDKMSHVMFAGLAHEPAYRLAARLSAFAPDGLERVFFSDSGSTSVEVTLKMALQYWKNTGKPRKNKFICLENGYHGDTFGAMAVSGRGGMHKAFDSLLTKHYVLEIPTDEYSFAEFEDTVAAISHSVAALIVEPLVQGAGGMKFYSADILSEMRRVCREHDILLIADEIMTGFHRIGSRFACDEAGITPDIMCVGKGLTGGAMTLAATLATNQIFEAFLDDDLFKALMHGPTFMGNPLACAAANASLDLFEQEPRMQQAEAIETQLHDGLRPLHGLPGVVDVRCKGALGVVQIEATQDDMFALRPQFLEKGVWLRPFNDVIYIMPPLVISHDTLAQVIDATVEIATRWSKER